MNPDFVYFHATIRTRSFTRRKFDLYFHHFLKIARLKRDLKHKITTTLKRSWASAARGRGERPPWILIHGTNIVDKVLMVLFFGLFSVPPPPWKRLSSAIFRFFFCWLPPLENFLPTPLELVVIFWYDS